jgi:threonine aldolase
VNSITLHTAEAAEIRAACERFLPRHEPHKSAGAGLAELASASLADLPVDKYGEGAALGSVEHEITDLLGKQVGVFFVSGVMAQLCALRVHCDRAGLRTVAIHPKSHIDLDEDGAYERLHGCVGLRIGPELAHFRIDDLDKLREPVGVVVVELPLRRAGFELLPWDELEAIAGWCRDRKVPLHIDGARLWECGPAYGRSYAEIAALADSVYVSFYKGLGAIAGCVLAGTASFMEEAKVWKERHGGRIHSVFPYVISAKAGLEHHLPRMTEYRERAQDLARALDALPGVRVSPDPPHTNAFWLYLPGDHERLVQSALALASARRVWLFDRIEPTSAPGVSSAEVQIGDAASKIKDDEIVALIAEVLRQA